MPRPKRRAPEDRLVDLHEGGARLGYASESLRVMMHTSENPPPFFKHNGRWRAWLSDLDDWVAREAVES